jgi:hypothetical protein
MGIGTIIFIIIVVVAYFRNHNANWKDESPRWEDLS